MQRYLILFIEVSRINNIKPAMMLFLPCLWGLLLAYDSKISTSAMTYAAILFFIGAIAARSFGCIINDIMDKDIDRMVERTKNRPITRGDLRVEEAIVMSLIWLVVGFVCMMAFNIIAKYFIIGGLFIGSLYPLAKRFIKVPQIVLGICFNIGALVGYAAVYRDISYAAAMLYVCGFYWTMFYDTIYAMQDVNDDKRIGVNSSVIYYGDRLGKKLITFIIMSVGANISTGILISAPWFFYAFSFLIFSFFMAMLAKLSNSEKINYQKIFELNSLVGFLILMQLLISKVYG
jgi:4-hydroxybenzoate polyprenyltransferase